MRKQITKTILGFIEKELVTTLAVLIVLVGTIWAKADTSVYTNLSFTVNPAGDWVSVTAPNGGESWTVGTVQNITWSSSGFASNVKIELQRTPSGAWETIIASTDNDGSYPWTVAGNVTTTALMKITEVDDDTINDQSNAVFSIVAASTTTEGGISNGGGYFTVPVGIDSVKPNIIVNNVDTTLTIGGFNFVNSAMVLFDGKSLSTKFINTKELEAIVPAKWPIGDYQLCVRNDITNMSCFGVLIKVVLAEEKPTTPTPELPVKVPVGYYDYAWIKSPNSITVKPNQETTIAIHVKNTGTLPWVNYGANPVRLGTEKPKDRTSKFYNVNWILKNRPATVVTMIKPGDTAKLEFKIKAPNRPGSYREYFNMVVEYQEWMRDKGMYFDIQVKSDSIWRNILRVPESTKPTQKVAPTPCPVPQKPVETELFMDTTERIFQWFTNLFKGGNFPIKSKDLDVTR